MKPETVACLIAGLAGLAVLILDLFFWRAG